MKNNLSLSALISSYIGGGLLILSLILGILIQQGISRFLDNALHAKANALVHQLATVSLDAIMIYDYGTLERYVRDISAQPDMLYLRIRRQNGDVLAEMGIATTKENQSTRITLTQPIKLVGNPIGEITVSYDRSQLDKTITQFSIIALCGILLLTLLLYFLLRYLLNHRLIQPIQQLALESSPLHKHKRVNTQHLPKELIRIEHTFSSLCSELETYSNENVRIQRMARNAIDRLCQAKRLATVGQIAAEIAHNINTPLGNILGYAQQAQKQTNDPKLLKKLRVIENQSRSCSESIRIFLKTARPPEAHPRVVEIKSQMNNVLEIITPIMQDKGILTLKIESQDNFWVWADPSCIEQVTFNLLGNAADAKATKVSIKLFKENHRGILTVQDNGSGIPEEIQTKIFDAFFTSKPVGEGTGLGLHICKTLLQSVGAKFDLVKSQPGNTIFRIAWHLVDQKKGNTNDLDYHNIDNNNSEDKK